MHDKTSRSFIVRELLHNTVGEGAAKGSADRPFLCDPIPLTKHKQM